jgi:hypothetical protein
MTKGWRPSIGNIFTGVIIVAVAFAIWAMTPSSTTTPSSGVQADTFWDFLSENWLWGFLVIVAWQFGTGIWQQRKNYSYSGDAMYYLFGGGGLILGLAVIFFDYDLVQSVLNQGRAGNQTWLQAHVDSGNAWTSIIEHTDWWTAIGVAAFVGGIGVAIASLVQSKTLRLIVAVPFLVFGVIVGLTAGYDAAPERLKETLGSVAAVIPFVETPLEQQANADSAAAEAADAEVILVLAEIARTNADARLSAERRGKPEGAPSNLEVPECSADRDTWHELQTPARWSVTDSWGADIVTHQQFHNGNWVTAQPERTGVSANRWCKHNERYGPTDMLLTWKYIGPV